MLSRTKKRTLALFLAIVMVMGLLPTAALADEFGPETVTTETVVLEPMESAAPEETAQPAQSAAPEETAQPAQDRKSTRLNSSHIIPSRMPSSA